MTTIPEPCRTHLLELHAKAQVAKQLYDAALIAAVSALGLDPKGDFHINLTAGTIAPAEPPKE